MTLDYPVITASCSELESEMNKLCCFDPDPASLHVAVGRPVVKTLHMINLCVAALSALISNLVL